MTMLAEPETRTLEQHTRTMSILMSQVLRELQALPPHHERARVGRKMLEILDTLDTWEVTGTMDSTIEREPEPWPGTHGIDRWDVV